jgi:hypothetical protein
MRLNGNSLATNNTTAYCWCLMLRARRAFFAFFAHFALAPPAALAALTPFPFPLPLPFVAVVPAAVCTLRRVPPFVRAGAMLVFAFAQTAW